MVYILIREGVKPMVFKEKTALADEIGVVRATVARNLKGGEWHKEGFSVYEVEVLPKKSARGGRNRRF